MLVDRKWSAHVPNDAIDPIAELPDLQKSGVLRMSLSIGKICPAEMTLLIWTANPDQIVGGQVGKNLGVNVVLAERLLVLPQSQTVQPSRNVHGYLLARFLRRAPASSAYPKISRQAR
jgi:hypothetical protein